MGSVEPRPITATTRLAAVIGDPVRHSKSPAIHNAAFAACDIDGVYVALPVASAHVATAVQAMRSFDWFGLSVTMPHKQAVLDLCDELTPAARSLGAANCLFWRDGSIVGDNTDGAGFVRGLRSDLGVEPAGRHCAIVGAGGAAGAIAFALAQAGADRVTVVNRTPENAVAVANLATGVGRVGAEDDLSTADLVVNATPLGMGSTDLVHRLPFDISRLRADAVVCDLIYHPAETLLLAAARRRSLACQNGLPMLVHQAVAQFEHWTGATAPLEVMTAAVQASLTP